MDRASAMAHATWTGTEPRLRRGDCLHRRRFAAGFNLTEVMFSILILGVGLIAVASLFPVAGTLQRNTYDDALLQQVSENVRSLIRGRGFSPADLLDPIETADDVWEHRWRLRHLADFAVGRIVPMPPKVLGDESEITLPGFLQGLGSLSTALRVWNEGSRGYPLPNDAGLDATHYWVPLMQPSQEVVKNTQALLHHSSLSALTDVPDTWMIYVFILKPEQDVRYSRPEHRDNTANPTDGREIPAIRDVPAARSPASPHEVIFASPVARGTFEEGDWVLDNVGGIHRVVEVISATRLRLSNTVSPAATKLWYAERGRVSPTRLIIRVPNVVL